MSHLPPGKDNLLLFLVGSYSRPKVLHNIALTICLAHCAPEGFDMGYREGVHYISRSKQLFLGFKEGDKKWKSLGIITDLYINSSEYQRLIYCDSRNRQIFSYAF